jgi:hypothetical protein
VPVAQVNEFGRSSPRGAAQAVPDERIHDDLRTANHLFGLGGCHRLQSRCLKDLELIARRPGQRRRLPGEHHPDGEAAIV